MAIKTRLGKLKCEGDFKTFIMDQVKSHILEILDISSSHTIQTYYLPDIHKDPFDRLLISQALTENLNLITSDQIIKQYPGIQIIWS